MLGRSLWRSFFLLMLSGILLCLSVYCSLAWFSSSQFSEGFGFGAGTLRQNALHVALIKRTGEEDTPPTEEMRDYYPCDGTRFNVDHYPTQNGENTYTVELSDLSLGIIDNVARVKPENKIFLRLTVPKESGDTVAVKLYYGAYENGRFAELYKNVYDDDGKTVLNQTQVREEDALPSKELILESFHAVEDEDSCYLGFSLLVSNELIPPEELANADFRGSDGEPAKDGKGSFYRVNAFDAESDGIVLRNEEIDTAGEFYYVYVRIEPDLAVFGQSIEYISGIMPCYLFFKLNAMFVVYPGQEV